MGVEVLVWGTRVIRCQEDTSRQYYRTSLPSPKSTLNVCKEIVHQDCLGRRGRTSKNMSQRTGSSKVQPGFAYPRARCLGGGMPQLAKSRRLRSDAPCASQSSQAPSSRHVVLQELDVPADCSHASLGLHNLKHRSMVRRTSLLL